MELPETIATAGGEPILRAAFERLYDPQAAAILARRDDGKVPLGFQAQQRRKIILGLAWAQQIELEAKRSAVDFTPEAMAKLEAEERRHILDWEAWLARINQNPAIRHDANVVYLRERALFEAHSGPLAATQDELRAAYDTLGERTQNAEELVRASHLLITFGPRIGDEKIQPLTAQEREAATPEQLAAWDALALARATALRGAAMAPGVDFGEFAREYSEGPGAFRGGDMGLFPFRQMVPEYAKAVFALEPGTFSEPIRSDKGYYVIKSFGHYSPGLLPFEAMRPDLVRQVEGAKYKQAKQTLETELNERFPVASAVLDDATAFKGR